MFSREEVDEEVQSPVLYRDVFQSYSEDMRPLKFQDFWVWNSLCVSQNVFPYCAAAEGSQLKEGIADYWNYFEYCFFLLKKVFFFINNAEKP